MKNFEQIIEQNTAELKTGNMQSYLDVLDDSICRYERSYGPLAESAYLRNYVRSCFRNDLAQKNGHNSFGRKQFSKYIARWFRKVGSNQESAIHVMCIVPSNFGQVDTQPKQKLYIGLVSSLSPVQPLVDAVSVTIFVPTIWRCDVDIRADIEQWIFFLDCLNHDLRGQCRHVIQLVQWSLEYKGVM